MRKMNGHGMGRTVWINPQGEVFTSQAFGDPAFEPEQWGFRRVEVPDDGDVQPPADGAPSDGVPAVPSGGMAPPGTAPFPGGPGAGTVVVRPRTFVTFPAPTYMFMRPAPYATPGAAPSQGTLVPAAYGAVGTGTMSNEEALLLADEEEAGILVRGESRIGALSLLPFLAVVGAGMYAAAQ